MAKAQKAKELFTASEVARFCQVDLKTIHNWSDRGEIRHFRTPGRHLRFRRADVLDFLRRYGYPIPELLQQGRPRVLVICANGQTESMQRVLSKAFDVHFSNDPYSALIQVGAETPDVVVLEQTVDGVDTFRLIQLFSNTEATRRMRSVLFADGEDGKRRALDAGASAVVVKPDTQRLKDTLDALMGVER